MKIKNVMMPGWLADTDRHFAALGVRKVSDRCEWHNIYTSNPDQSESLRVFAGLVDCLQAERYSVPDVVAAMKRELTSILRGEGCKPPHYKPATTDLCISFAERVYAALRDVRILGSGKGDVVAAAFRLSTLVVDADHRLISSFAAEKANKLEVQLQSKHKGASIQAQKAKARRECHCRLATEMHAEFPELSRADVSWELHNELSAPTHPDHEHAASHRTIYRNIGAAWNQ